jgi:hypothetical protein
VGGQTARGEIRSGAEGKKSVRVGEAKACKEGTGIDRKKTDKILTGAGYRLWKRK